MENGVEKMHSAEKNEGSPSLREATEEDQRFLFDLVRTAMQPVYEASGQVVSNDDDAFKEFQEKFNPDEVQVVQMDGKDVGRLRVLRSPECIFVGGIHVLPEYQGQGIGTSILTDLIEESNQTATPIALEVRDVNEKAINLYKRLGFVPKEQKEHMVIMEYIPPQNE